MITKQIHLEKGNRSISQICRRKNRLCFTFSFDGPGVLVCSIDNMPTQLPLEATTYFGSKLLPLIPQMFELDAKKDFQMQPNLPRIIRDVS